MEDIPQTLTLQTLMLQENQEISLMLKFNVGLTEIWIILFLSRNHMESILSNKQSKWKRMILFNSEILFLTSLVQVQFECGTLDHEGLKS
jgi:hypothetical protein